MVETIVIAIMIVLIVLIINVADVLRAKYISQGIKDEEEE